MALLPVLNTTVVFTEALLASEIGSLTLSPRFRLEPLSDFTVVPFTDQLTRESCLKRVVLDVTPAESPWVEQLRAAPSDV